MRKTPLVSPFWKDSELTQHVTQIAGDFELSEKISLLGMMKSGAPASTHTGWQATHHLLEHLLLLQEYLLSIPPPSSLITM
jgi:hypothetical protein